jgi:glycosyltransferase involved in cell wall biosynthesis
MEIQQCDRVVAPASRILVFIPAYNCAPQIGRVLAQFKDVPSGIFEEILVVDNQSRDDTARAALEQAAHVAGIRVQVVRNNENYGLGGSHKSAFAYAEAAGFTHVVVLHGDDQGRISDIVPLIQSGMHCRYDSCLGSRFMRGSRLRGYAFTRILGNHVFNLLFSAVSFRWITDLGSGLNIFARQVFTDPAILRYSDDLRFNCYLLLGLVRSKATFRYFPITWSEEDQISNVKIVTQSLRTLKIVAEYLFQRRRFLTDEHRDHPRLTYGFTTLGEFPALPSASRRGVLK